MDKENILCDVRILFTISLAPHISILRSTLTYYIFFVCECFLSLFVCVCSSFAWYFRSVRPTRNQIRSDHNFTNESNHMALKCIGIPSDAMLWIESFLFLCSFKMLVIQFYTEHCILLHFSSLFMSMRPLVRTDFMPVFWSFGMWRECCHSSYNKTHKILHIA